MSKNKKPYVFTYNAVLKREVEQLLTFRIKHDFVLVVTLTFPLDLPVRLIVAPSILSNIIPVLGRNSPQDTFISSTFSWLFNYSFDNWFLVYWFDDWLIVFFYWVDDCLIEYSFIVWWLIEWVFIYLIEDWLIEYSFIDLMIALLIDWLINH